MSSRPPTDREGWGADAIERFVKEEITRKRALMRLGGGGVLLTLPSLLAACGGDDDEAQQTTTPEGSIKKGGRFSMARNEEPLSLDPIVPSDNGSIWVIYQMFDQLTTVNEDSSGVAPSIAESWEISDDGTVYTFAIRQGVMFHDGSPMTIDDVVFSLERVFDPKGSGYSFLFGVVDGVKAVDEATVQVSLKEPFTPLLDNLNVFPASIVPKALVEPDLRRLRRTRSGPAPSSSGVRQGAPRPTAEERELLEGGSATSRRGLHPVCHRRQHPHPQVAGRGGRRGGRDPVRADRSAERPGRHRRQDRAALPFRRHVAQPRQAPLDDVKVRQALNYATDKESMLKSIYFDKVEIANNMMPKMKYWREDVAPYEYDPEQAKSLMAQSKAADGFTLPIVIPTGDVITQQIAQILKESYSAIGVDVQITNLDIGTAYTNFSSFNYTAGANWYTSRATCPHRMSWPRSSSTTAPRAERSPSSRTTTARRQPNWSRKPVALTTRRGSSLFGELQQLVMDDAVLVALFFHSGADGAPQPMSAISRP